MSTSIGPEVKRFFESWVRLGRLGSNPAAWACAWVVLVLIPTTLLGDDARISFSRDIRPILAGHCLKCHGPDESSRAADLRLDTEEGAKVALEVEGGLSKLMARVTSHDPELLMPPPDAKKPLTEVQIQLLAKWVEAGAPWGKHWAFEPLVAPPLPVVEANASDGVTSKEILRNPIDYFVQARLASRGIQPASIASRETLIRRVTLDLIGLPPTLEEIDAFLEDRSEDAWEKVVDRLLKSPEFGERMAWNWLDAARYADSNGYQGDGERTMWPWRDWVIEAFNENLPYDEFTLWQLAGDLIPNATFEQKLATGFCRNHMINGEGGRIAEENRVEYVMDMTETTGTVWLGLTVNCCRCHDHKFDPLTQRDYYQLSAFFNQTAVDGSGGNPQTPPVVEAPTTEQSQNIAELEMQIATLQQSLQSPQAEGADPMAELEKLKKGLSDLRSSIPKVMVMEDMATPRKTWMLSRGVYSKHGDEVTANVPGQLPQLRISTSNGSDTTGGEKIDRLALARWMISDDNPLTARVTVNRIWQQFFGIGLVKTTEDFGIQGEIPIQQDLLDWLAADFRSNGWDVKRLVRQIVTSRTYRQSSRIKSRDGGTENLSVESRGMSYEEDPENRYLSRGPRFRLPSWMLRDQALAASGLMVRRLGGPPVRGYQPSGVWEEATFGVKKYEQDHGDALYRRSLYTFWRRIVAPTMFFDNASRQTCTVKTFRTNTPLHALLTLNDVTFVEAARALSESVLMSNIQEDGDRIDLVFRKILARRATEAEKVVLLSAIGRSRLEFQADPLEARKLLAVGESKRHEQLDLVEHAAWTSLSLAVMNLDEAVTKE